MIKTNKDKLLTLAFQGQVVPAQVVKTYQATWDGRAKMCIGIGGINYNLKTGMEVFGWANGDRADYRQKTGVGNRVQVTSGDAKGDYGAIIGKHGYRLPGNVQHILVHFNDGTLDNLNIGDKLKVKSRCIGLRISGYDDVMVHSSSPELIEGMGIEDVKGKLKVPVALEAPAKIVGAGYGTQAHSSHIDIQTCYPPDIKEYGLDRLRFGDIVALRDVGSNYGRHYYRGATTIGIVCSGPSEISGQGIGITTILSNLDGRIDPVESKDANLVNILELE
jgi:hypothetical protein